MKSKISLKTLQDLEFDLVLKQVSEYCQTQMGKSLVTKIIPFASKDILQNTLQLTNEYLGSYESENRCPSHYFESVESELHLLNIEDSYLDINAFLRLNKLAETAKMHLHFLKKYKDYFPKLYSFSEETHYNSEISKAILSKLTPYGEVHQKASPILNAIRKDILEVKGKISSSFNSVLSKSMSSDFLDDIKESVVDNQRVLAVKAMYRKKIKGLLLGTSKSGSIVFIAPEATQKLTRELQNLEFEEKQEIINILRALSAVIRPFSADLEAYQEYLSQIDSIAAKASYAKNINAILPHISDAKECFFKDAYHPLLLEQNNRNDKITIPQTLTLNQEQHIIVISGPNAGGKSITLKTIGLLQVMFQSGLLVPVHRESSFHIFDIILTDIGDNQSIEIS